MRTRMRRRTIGIKSSKSHSLDDEGEVVSETWRNPIQEDSVREGDVFVVLLDNFAVG